MTRRSRFRRGVVPVLLVLMIGIAGCNLGLNETPEDGSSGPEGYTLLFDSNGGTGTIASRRLAEGEVTTLPTDGFTRAGGTLQRWTDDRGTSFDLGASFTMPARDVTMQAAWKLSDFYPGAFAIGNDKAQTFHVDSSGELTAAGTFAGTIDLDPREATEDSFTAAGSADGFFLRLAPEAQ